MSVINSMGVGKAKGSMGNVTYTTDAAGRTIGRQKPTTVANPKTEGQEAQRNNFKVIVSFMSGILNILNSNWKRTKSNIAPYSEAVGMNVLKVGKQAKTLVEIAGIRLQVTKGILQGMVNQVMVSNGYDISSGEWTLRLEWSNIFFGNASASDKVQLILFNISKGQQEGISSVSKRDDTQIQKTFLLTYPLDVYVVFIVTENVSSTLFGTNYTLAYYDGNGVVAATV